MVGGVIKLAADAECTCHFHNTYGLGMANVCTGMDVGVKCFESCVAGLGSCPFTKVAAGNLANVVLTVVKVSGIAAIPLMALAVPKLTPDFSVPAAPGSSWLVPFGIAMIAVFWAYEGWYFLTYAAGEVREPHRTLPRALVVGCVALTAIYVGVNLAYLYALPIDQIRGVSRIGERAASALVGSWGATLVSVTVLVSTLGANAAALRAGPRLLFAMAFSAFWLNAFPAHPLLLKTWASSRLM